MKLFRDLKFKKIPNNLPTAVKRFDNDFEIEVCKLGADSFTLRVYHYKESYREPLSYSPLEIIGMIKPSYSSYEICRAIYKITKLRRDHEISGDESWYLNSTVEPVYCN
jgi:hypothetical protein